MFIFAKENSEWMAQKVCDVLVYEVTKRRIQSLENQYSVVLMINLELFYLSIVHGVFIVTFCPMKSGLVTEINFVVSGC